MAWLRGVRPGKAAPTALSLLTLRGAKGLTLPCIGRCIGGKAALRRQFAHHTYYLKRFGWHEGAVRHIHYIAAIAAA